MDFSLLDEATQRLLAAQNPEIAKEIQRQDEEKRLKARILADKEHIADLRRQIADITLSRKLEQLRYEEALARSGRDVREQARQDYNSDWVVYLVLGFVVAAILIGLFL